MKVRCILEYTFNALLAGLYLNISQCVRRNSASVVQCGLFEKLRKCVHQPLGAASHFVRGECTVSRWRKNQSNNGGSIGLRADAKMTPPWFVASGYYQALINLLKYLLYLFIIRTPRCGLELSRASKQLPLNSSCNGHAECAGVQSDFISLRSSDRAYITRARFTGGCHERFPHCSPVIAPEAIFVRSFSLYFLCRGFSVFCDRRERAGAH